MKNLGYVGDSPLEKCDTIIEGIKTKPTAEDDKVYSFEEAVALTGIGKFHYFLQFICGICLMAANIELICISIILPFMDSDLPTSIAEKGYLASAEFVGIVMSSHATGFFADTWGRVKMLRCTLTLSFIISFVSAFSVNIWMFIILRFLTGIIMSACQSCVYNFVGEYHSKKTRSKYVTMFSIFSPIGLIFLPALAMGILPLKLAPVFGMKFGSWRLLILCLSFLRIIACVGLFITAESPKYVLMQGDHEQALKTLRKMFSINTGKAESDYPVQQVFVDLTAGSLNSVSSVKDAMKLIWIQTVPLFYKNRVLYTLNIALIMFLISGMGHGMLMWEPTLLKEQIASSGHGYTICNIFNLPNNTVKSLTAVEENSEITVDVRMFQILMLIGIGFTISYFICSLTINWVGKKKMLVGWVFMTACCWIGIIWIESFEWQVFVYTLITSLNSSTGIVFTVAMEFFPTNVSAMGVCLITMISRIGSTVGSNIVGVLLYTNCDILFYIGFVLCFLIALLSLGLPK